MMLFNIFLALPLILSDDFSSDTFALFKMTNQTSEL
jgi:hypothetical protein